METDAIASPFAQSHWVKPVEKGKGKGKAGRRTTRGMKREGGNNKQLARSKLQTVHVSNDNGARRLILASERGYTGPRLRLRSHTLTSVNQHSASSSGASISV